MKYPRKITIISIVFLSLFVFLAAGCGNEASNTTASNQNAHENKPQTAAGDGTIVDSSDINGPSANAKPVPGGTINHASSTPTPKSSATPNIAANTKTPQPEPTKSSEADVAAKTSPTPSAPIKYVLGPRGNCYFTNDNGRKIFVARSMCGVGNETNNPSRPNISQPSNDTRQYILGPQGRCFFMDSSGAKVFVARTRCNQ